MRSGAGGLGWWRLGRVATTGASRMLHQAYRFQAMSALQNRRGTVQAVRALRAAGIEPLLGRGAAAAVAYPEPGLRPYGDVDLHVPQEAAGDAREALRRRPPCLHVDLHAGFGPLNDRPANELLRRSRKVDLEGHAIRVFGAEDHLRLLGLHFLKHGGWRPLWLCDIAALLEAEGSSLDWGYFGSGDERRTDAVARVLTLAGELLGARLDSVPRELASRRPPRWMTEQVLRAWGNPDFVPHGCRRPIARTRGAGEILRGLRQRWPNGVEATAARGAWFDAGPRLPLQLAECLARVAGFAARHAARQTS